MVSVPLAMLVLVLVLVVLLGWQSRTLSRFVVLATAALSIAGVLIAFTVDRGVLWSELRLQALLLAALAAVIVAVSVEGRLSGTRRSTSWPLVFLSGSLVLLVLFIAVFATSIPALQQPVGFLIGRAVAEDNAKWLDFSAQFASGGAIEQLVPMGGPLQLYLVFIATGMSAAAQLLFGGVNEVFVAANAVVFGQLLLAAVTPLALAPIAESRLKASRVRGDVAVTWVGVVIGGLVLTAASLLVTGYGHFTLQWTFFVAALWSAAFLSGTTTWRIRLLTSLIFAASMTVWLPLTALAAVVIVGWLAVLLRRGLAGGWAKFDALGFALTLLVGIGIAQPVRSSLSFLAASDPRAMGGSTGGVSASASFVPALFGEGSLFGSTGGTEQVGPILAVLTGLSVLGAAWVLSRQPGTWIRRFVPLGLLAGMSLAIVVLDAWSTGRAPNYGSLKFGYMVAIVALGTTVPYALMAIDWPKRGLTPMRMVGAGVVILLLAVDGLIPKAVHALRPEQWSPPIPFDNPRSYWWPAEVNGTADQSIASNPIGCVYLPQGALAPSAILDSGLSDPQRVYSCSRILTGLAGEDSEGQPFVDWLRREWLTNQRAWSDVYGYLEAMPDSVKSKPVILLDDGSNVIGLESLSSLLARFPAQPS